MLKLIKTHLKGRFSVLTTEKLIKVLQLEV